VAKPVGGAPPLPAAIRKPNAALVADQLPNVRTPVSVRGQVGELSGSMAMAAVLAVLTTTLWAAVLRSGESTWIGPTFFTTVALSWAVLVPGKFWDERVGDGWSRRLVMMLMGALVGLGALWLNGWTPDVGRFLRTLDPGGTVDDALLSAGSDQATVALGAGYVSYFGLLFGLMRWWRLTDRRRKAWFSVFPVLAAGFWGLLLMFVWPGFAHLPPFGNGGPPPYGLVAAVTAAAVVQWVSPWQAPAPALPKRLRLRPVS
jgi:hypothetical protein